MSEDFYKQPDQSIYIVDEHTYGEHYDPETEHAAWIAIAATFPHVIPVNVITDSFDYDIPKILKEKIFAIGGGKHASMVVNTIQEPVEVSFETKMQNPVFLAYAIGDTASTGTRAEISTVTCLAKGSCVQDSYFLINDLDASGEKHYAIWIDVSGSGSKPTIAGINASNVIQANISGDTTDVQVATTVTTAINTTSSITATNGGGTLAVVTCTNDNDGAVRDVRDSGTVATGFSFAVTTQGANTHTVTEETGFDLPSFTMHIEQRNTDSNEDIIVDLFGCVITNYELTVDYGDKIVKESVTLKTVNFALGNRLTNAPAKVHLIEPHTWVNLKGTSNYILREGVTDKTPEIVKKTVLKITNEVEFQPELESRYPQTVTCGKKEVTLNIVGHTKKRDTFDYYRDTWDTANNRYSSASGRLNTQFKLERDATYDYMLISVYNWLIEEHNHHVFNVDDKMKSLDITLTEATPDSNLRIIDSFTIVDYLSDTCYQNSFS